METESAFGRAGIDAALELVERRLRRRSGNGGDQEGRRRDDCVPR
jgi:hypothetical protein